jgi:hypothetical protein
VLELKAWYIKVEETDKYGIRFAKGLNQGKEVLVNA